MKDIRQELKLDASKTGKIQGKVFYAGKHMTATLGNYLISQAR